MAAPAALMLSLSKHDPACAGAAPSGAPFDGLRTRAVVTVALPYDVAIIKAARETGLDEDAFPAACPWTFARATSDFWPE